MAVKPRTLKTVLYDGFNALVVSSRTKGALAKLESIAAAYGSNKLIPKMADRMQESYNAKGWKGVLEEGMQQGLPALAAYVTFKGVEKAKAYIAEKSEQ